MPKYTVRVTCPEGHVVHLDLISPTVAPDGTVSGGLSSRRDFCGICETSINDNDVVWLADGEPMPRRIGVWLSDAELGLIRAGLAAHAIALSGNPPRPTPKETETIIDTLKGNFHRHEVAKKQREACRELSIRLGDAQIQVNG